MVIPAAGRADTIFSIKVHKQSILSTFQWMTWYPWVDFMPKLLVPFHFGRKAWGSPELYSTKTLFYPQREIHESYSCMLQIFAAYLCLPQIFVANSVCPNRMSMPQPFEAFLKKTQMTEAYWVCRKYLRHTWVCHKYLRQTQVWLVYLPLRMGGMKNNVFDIDPKCNSIKKFAYLWISIPINSDHKDLCKSLRQPMQDQRHRIGVMNNVDIQKQMSATTSQNI